MDFLSVREFRNSPKAVWTKLDKEGKLIITVNGKPAGLLFPINAATLEDTLADVSRIEAKQALRALRQQAAANGTAAMTMDDIDAEIALARKERRKSKNEKK